MKRLANLFDRAHMLSAARQFFKDRKVLEVDCPILTEGASIDAHIDLMPALFNGNETRYLHSSPEYGMKRLLVEGIGDIYQISHVFRDSEFGRKHNPEFCMVEWYRLGFTFEDMIQETVDFIRLFLGPLPSTTLSYRDAFLKLAEIDYLRFSNQQLLDYLKPFSYPDIDSNDKDALLNLILGIVIEPKLGQDELTVLAYYPHTQAALAKKHIRDQEQVALRFEVYYKGVELANGYQELADPKEQRQRFQEANTQRLALQKQPLPLDEKFLTALEKGLPECCGVAVGFDRLMMLRNNADSLKEVIPFDWASS